MTEAPFETLFGSCVVEIIAPDTSVLFPEDVSTDEWLAGLKESKVGREQAFFDEQLRLFLTMQIDYPSPNEPPHTHGLPQHLVDFLSHIQVSLEATYISQKPESDLDTQQVAVLAPPRTSSSGLKGRPPSLHPSIFPPSTPNPIPSTTEGDRKYVQSEGILLLSSIWGANKSSGQDKERFSLLFSEAQGVWIAVYEFSLVVSYLRLPFSDPLLCLTASATLRDHSLSLSQTNHPFVIYLSEKGMIHHQDPDGPPERGVSDEDEEDDTTGLEEVNLLEGLSIDALSDNEPLYMPSTRLGNVTRKQLYSLPPVSSSRNESPTSTWKRPHHILRKSYRRVLQTVSGFRVRMRTVFVPHVLLPKDGDSPGSYPEDMDEEWEAGNNEQTVVLCVEVENSGESGPDVGFSLERVGVNISGDGATSRLVGWGDTAFAPDVEQHLFPLLIGSMEQFNLLYIVSFLNVSNDKDGISLTGPAKNDSRDLQRAVTITIYGRPYFTSTKLKDGSDTLSYPTGTFSSIWNCILDLSSKPREEPPDFHEPFGAPHSALPEPPSPLPGHNTLPSFLSPPSTPKPTPQAIAGKRHTLPANVTAMRAINSSANARFSMPPRDQNTSSPMPPSQIVFTPQSTSMQASSRPPPTTFSVPPQTPGVGGFNPNIRESQAFTTPPTPAYPAFPPSSAPPNTPYAQALGSQQGYSGPSVEIRRERGTGMMSTVPQTPLPTIYGPSFDPQQPSQLSGEPVIVSVGLLPIKPDEASERFQRKKIYPSDKFTLDIFVYNRSSWTRRFEVSCLDLDRRRRRKVEQNHPAGGQGSKTALEELKAAIEPPGILPMQNRVRVGPLRPSTCQSVRMDFIALSPGVHSVDVLTLTDIETGYSVNLRSVTDIVVHERDEGGDNTTTPTPSQTSPSSVE